MRPVRRYHIVREHSQRSACRSICMFKGWGGLNGRRAFAALVGVLKIISNLPYAFNAQDLETLQLMASFLGNALGQQLEMEQRQAQETQLRDLAEKDALTGLPNRVLLNDRLMHAMSLSKRNTNLLALMYMDIDHFKQVNDTYGHGAGDALLQGFAIRVQSTIRASDTFGRLSGDEFIIIAENLQDIGGAAVIAKKVISALHTPFMLGEQPLKASTSIGIAIYNSADLSPADLIQQADEALYEAKRTGRGKYCFQPEWRLAS